MKLGFMILPWILFVLIKTFPVLTLSGCTSAMSERQTVAEPRNEMVRMEWKGVKGWFVPDDRLESIGLKMDELINNKE